MKSDINANNKNVRETNSADNINKIRLNSSEAQRYVKAYSLSLYRVKEGVKRTRANNKPGWTEKELEILREFYPSGGYKECQEKGVEKTMYAITSQATLMGLGRNIPGNESVDDQGSKRRGYHTKWSDDELKLLNKYFPVGGYELCVKKGLDKTEDEVIVKVNKLMRERKAELIKKGFITPARWTKRDIQILLDYYPVGGTSLCQEKGLNKKNSSIRMMAKSLDIPLNKEKPWTAKEDNILVKTFEMYNSKESCYEALPGRTKTDINNRLKELNLVLKRKWTKEEVELIKTYFPQGGARLVIEKGVNRDVREIGAKASNMGIKISDGRNYWTQEEEEILKKYYPEEGIAVVDRLKGKDKLSVRNKVRYMKLNGPTNKWTDEEVEILKKYYPCEGGKVLDRLPNKTAVNIYYKASLMKLSRKEGKTNNK